MLFTTARLSSHVPKELLYLLSLKELLSSPLRVQQTTRFASHVTTKTTNCSKREKKQDKEREEGIVDNVQNEDNKKRHMEEEQEEEFCVEISLVESQDEEQQQLNEKEGIALQVLTNLKVKIATYRF